MGSNVSPPLNWSKTPINTREFALICYNPDAPYTYGFTHWVIYGIPPEITGIEEDKGKLFTEGVNSTGKMGYSGPAPPPANG